jgi:hypothetical protein
LTRAPATMRTISAAAATAARGALNHALGWAGKPSSSSLPTRRASPRGREPGSVPNTVLVIRSLSTVGGTTSGTAPSSSGPNTRSPRLREQLSQESM